MSDSASITARLGLDAAGFRSELNDSARATDAAANRMTSGFGRTTGAHERLLGTNHRVARQIQNFSRDLISGASASQVFASGLEGIERSLRLPLGALAGLGIGAVLFEGISKARKEAEEFDKEFDKITAGSGTATSRSAEAVTEQLAAVRKQKAELEKQQGDPGFFGFIRDTFTSNKPTSPFNVANQNAEERQGKIEKLGSIERKLLDDLATKEKNLARIQDIRIHGSERQAELDQAKAKFTDQIAAASTGPDANPAKVAALRQLQQQELELINNKFDALQRELDLKIRINNIEGGSGSAAQKNIQALKLELELRDKLANEPNISEEERQKRFAAAGTTRNQLRGAEVDEFLKTPAQKRAEFNEGQKRDLASRTIAANERDAADRRRRGAYNSTDPYLSPDVGGRPPGASVDMQWLQANKHLEAIEKNTSDIGKNK